MNTDQSFSQPDELYDVRDLQKWNCIIEPTVSGYKSYGGLYLGDIDCAQDPFLLQQLKIGALLSVIDEPQIMLPEFMNYLVRETIAIPDCASESLIYYFPRCSAYIERHRAHTNIMVHCFAGISRSASVVIAYLMEKFDWSFDRTLGTVKAVRKQIKPNHGFAQQLQQYEVHIKHKKQQMNKPQQSKRPQSQQPNTKAQNHRDVTPTQRLSHPERHITRTESQANKTFAHNQDQTLFQSAPEDNRLTTLHQRYTMSPQKREEQQQTQILQSINNQTQTKFKENHSAVVATHHSDTKKATNNNDKHQLYNLAALEQEITKRQNSLAELQRKYYELQALNTQILISTQQAPQHVPQQTRPSERKSLQNYPQQLYGLNMTQPVNQSHLSKLQHKQPPQIYHFPFQMRNQ